MTENERRTAQPGGTKQKIRDRYRGVDASELEIIPAKPMAFETDGGIKRVAPYIRVSTENDEQTSSFELQKNYFTEYVSNQPRWVLVDIYADEGISGTSIAHRDGLQRLLEDCRAGKIDLIITKSISRFARNIVDCLTMIEELRNLKPPVGVIFETDHINTLGGNDSLLLSIMASLAETESYNKSVIMNWSIENRFKKGIFLLPELLGYDKDENGNLVVNPDEANTVRLCFYLFLAGFQLTEIADLLTDLGRRTGYNKQHNRKEDVEPEYNTVWTPATVISVLRNERHCGDVLARKTFTPNFKDHKAKPNRGEREQIRKRDDHEAIVPRAVFEAANRKLDMTYGRQDKPLPTLKVIDGGILRGYVPVDRTWGGFTSNDFVTASQSAYEETEAQEPKTAPASSLDGYRVVRAQMFNTQLYPALTISNGRLRFNTACLRRFGDVEYVEMLFNSVEKCVAIRPCEKGNPNAIHWGSLKENRWTVLEKSCRGFSAPLYEVMGWDTECKYRLRGAFQSDGKDMLMLFDLEEPEIIHRVPVEDVPSEPEEAMKEEKTDKGTKPQFRRVITFPEAWEGTFGKRVQDHYLERVHYAGNWDVLRPAQEVFGVNPITEEEIEALLYEAQTIIDTIRKAG